MKLFVLAALLMAGPVAAQTTTCRQNGNVTTCRDLTNATPFDYLGAMGGTEPTYTEQEEKRQSAQRINDSIQRERAAQNLREKVGKLISEGDCSGAEKAALKGGNLDLADRARSYCAKK